MPASPGGRRFTNPDVWIVTRTPHSNTYFPDIARMANGNLILTYFDSPEHGTNENGRVALVFGNSDGRSWSPPHVAVDTPGCEDRDPSIAALRSGRLILNWFRRDPDDFASSVGGVYSSYSDDNGETWSNPTRVHSPLSPAYVTAPVIELDDGRLLMPLYGYAEADESGAFTVAITASSDQGETWPPELAGRTVRRPDGGKVGLVEPVLVDLSSDRGLALLARSDGDPDNFCYLLRSDDGGLSWSTPERLPTPAQAPHILPIDEMDQRKLLVTWGDKPAGGYEVRPVMGKLVSADDKLDLSAATLIYRNDDCYDTSYPSSVQIDSDTFFTVFYDAHRGFIGGTFSKISDYL